MYGLRGEKQYIRRHRAVAAPSIVSSVNGVKAAPDKHHSELSARLGTVILERDPYSVRFRKGQLAPIKGFLAIYRREGTDGICKWTVMVGILGLQEVFLRFTNISGILCLLPVPSSQPTTKSE